MLFGVISPCIILPCPFQKIFSSFFQFGQVLREYTWHLVAYPHRQSRKRMMNTLGGGGLRIWNFQGYQRNSMCNFGGLIKIEVEFPRVTKKMWNFHGSLFLALEFPRDRIQFCGISTGWASKKTKNSRRGFKKVYPQPPFPLFGSFLE